MSGLAFLHVAKTGGTTVCDFLDTKYPPCDQFACESPEAFARADRSASARPLIRGHFNLADGVRLAGEHRGAPRIFFTVLREPRAHLMSLLWHWVSAQLDRVDGRHHPPFDEAVFRAHMTEAARLYGSDDRVAQYRYFADAPEEGQIAASLSRVQVVGISDRLDDTLRILCWRMRWPAPRLANTARFSGAGAHDVPAEIAPLLRRRMRMDRVAYAAASRRFAADFEALRQAADFRDIDAFLDRAAATI